MGGEMNNEVKFPKAKQRLPEGEPAPRARAHRMKKEPPKRGLLSWAWLIVRLPLFFVMYWMRLPIVGICNLVSIPTLLAFLFSLYAFPDKTQMVWLFGITSFLAFFIAWIYDFILMALSPQDMITTR